MATYEPMKQRGVKTFKSSGSRRKKDESNTAPNMKRLSPSGSKTNATGKSGKMQPTKQGSGRNMTNRTVAAAKRSMINPDLH
jgi:hypothetical protein